MKSGKWRKDETLHSKLKLAMLVASMHSHDATRVMKIDNWMKEIWVGAWKVSYNGREQRDALDALKMSIYSMSRRLEDSVDEEKWEEGWIWSTVKKLSFWFFQMGPIP
jgi:hypothetical protein